MKIDNCKQNYNIKSDVPKFKGHLKWEYIGKNSYGINELRHETAFFRQNDVLEFAKDYIEKNFPKKNCLKILDGACSTGEETWTLAMLFNKYKKLDLTGFDLGNKAIKTAQKGKYSITKLLNADKLDNLIKQSEAFDDSYLTFSKKNITEQEKGYKKLFSDFFTQTTFTSEKPTFLEKLKMQIFKSIPQVKIRNFEIKPQKTGLCKFAKGDIANLDKFSKNGETDMILFRNALYHLVTNNENIDQYAQIRKPKPEKQVRSTVEKIADEFNKKLKKDGIFVLGNNEPNQTLDKNMLIPQIFEEKGFMPILFSNGFPCVWKKP